MKINMLKQAVAVLSLFVFLQPSFAEGAKQDKANKKARALIERMKTGQAKRGPSAAAPLLNFMLSPAIPVQGQSLRAYIQSDNTFGNRLLSVDLKLNGTPVTNVQNPFKGLFVAALGVQSEVSTNNISATLYLEDPANNADVRDAVRVLDVDIRRLTNQVNAERDYAKRKVLEGQRAEKLALKDELLAQLKKYRRRVGSQNFSYRVGSDPSPNGPQISGVLPATGPVTGGTEVIISGQNFSPNVSVKFDGIPARNATFLSSTSVRAVTPDFDASIGPKNVELKFNTDGNETMVTAPAAFFAMNSLPTIPQKPIAIGGGSQALRLGDSVVLDGSQSYSNRETGFSYRWSIVSANANSAFSPGQVVGEAVVATFTPDVLGTYVLQLVVKELDTPEQLESDPSIVVVQAGGAPQPIANSISVGQGDSATAQVLANDPVQGQSAFFSITQAPQHGSADIRADGLVTFVADHNYIGADSMIVKVTNQSGLFGTVAIPIQVVYSNHAPVLTAGSILTHSEPGQAQVFAQDPDNGQAFSYELLGAPAHGTAEISSSGLVSYSSSAAYVGADEVLVRVTDNGLPNKSAEIAIPVTVLANTIPVVTAPSIAIAANTSGVSQATVTDDPFQTGTFSVGEPGHGTASISPAGLIQYSPDADFAGSDSFQVSFTDNGNPAAIGSATVLVVVNGAPSATAPPIVIATQDQGSSQIAVTDPNPGQAFTYQILSAPAHGSAEVSAGGLVTYTSNSGYTGQDSLVVKVQDDGSPQLFTSVTIPVDVTANHAPMASAAPIEVNANASGTSQITVVEEDAGQSHSYSIATQPERGVASVSASGLVTYTSTVAFGNTDSIGITVTDNGHPNLSYSFSVAVNVNGPANLAPVIPNGSGSNVLGFTLRSQGVPYMATMGLGFGATETIHDPDGSIVSAVWNFGDGTQESTQDFSGGAINHNYMAVGTYTATLTVTDNLGATASRQLEVEVLDTDIPTAKFTVSPSNGGGGVVPLTVTFDASASSDNDGITQYRWRFGNSATSEVITTNPVITRTFNSAGNVPVRLRTRDANRAQGEAIVPVTVGSTSTGSPIQAQFLVGPPREMLLGAPHGFDGSRSFNPNIGGSIVGWNWNYGDFMTCPGSGGGCVGTGLTTSYIYSVAGNYFPSLRVQNAGGGLSASVSQEVFVVNQGHAPRAIAKANVLAGVAPLTVNFSGAESYDYDGSISSYVWFFGDGTNPTCDPDCDNLGANLTHVFQNPGVYIVRMNAHDNHSNVTGATLTITVTATAQPKRKRTGAYDPDREYQRQLLAGACYDGHAESCSGLADMYAEDGDSFTASHLKARACQMGYTPACSKK